MVKHEVHHLCLCPVSRSCHQQMWTECINRDMLTRITHPATGICVFLSQGNQLKLQHVLDASICPYWNDFFCIRCLCFLERG